MLQQPKTFHTFKNDTRLTATEDEDFSGVFYTTYVPHKTGNFKINIHQAITSPDQFTYAVQALEAANEDNSVDISLQCTGGSLDATDFFIHHMRKCEGHIHVTATGNCSSAATFILLEADSFELGQNFNATLHCGSLGSGGTYSEYKQQTAFYNQYMEKTLRTFYEGFLTTTELDDMLNGKDIILDAAGWVERHEKRNQYFKAKIEAMNKPAKKPRKLKAIEI